LPPFHTHVIGSLPRPKFVIDLLQGRQELSPERYQAMMDEVVVFAIRLQERAGLDVVSDGEWRRVQYIREFLNRIGGFERCRRYQHQGEIKYTEVVVRRIESCEPVFAADARFLAAHTDRVTKFALPSPFLIAMRYWHEENSRDAYPTPQHFMDHLVEILSAEARALAEVGIDIVQIDDPALTYYCDRALVSGQSSHDERLRRDWNAEKEIPQAVQAINAIADGLAAQTHLHCCHSVYKRRSDVTGDYKPLLPYFEDLKVDRVNLEFAYQGTGDVTDLKLLPQHLGVGLGVVDVRGEHLPSVEQIEALAAAAIALIDPNRIALNPDCGFAPEALEPPSIDEAYEKLSRLTAAARNLRQRSFPPQPAGES
jgi:5-methyltetrahydropteroyltriglutamate--homocysteine methyltransferase